MKAFTTKKGREKSAPIAVLRQAKIYPPCKLRPPQIVDCGSWIAAAKFEGSIAAIHEKFSVAAAVGLELPQYKPFYTVPRKTHPKGDLPTRKLFCKRSKNKNCSMKNDLAYMAVDVLDLLCI